MLYSAHMVDMDTNTTDSRVTAVLEHDPLLKYVGTGTITAILDAAEATQCLDAVPADAPRVLAGTRA